MRTIVASRMAVLLSLVAGCTDMVDDAEQAETIAYGAPASVATDSASYGASAPITVNFVGLQGSTSDWVALAAPSAPDNTYVAWAFTDGSPSGSLAFPDGLPAGTYEARAFNNWSGTQAFNVVARSTSFVVGTTTTTDAPAYATGTPVIVTYSGLPGTATDWVAIAAPSSANTQFVAWTYTSGTPNGTVTFNNLPAGNYVARTFGNDGYDLVGQSAQFNVGLTGVTVSTTQPSYTSGQQIVVNYANLPGNPTDWIALAPVGAGPMTYTAWQYTTGPSGTATFDALPAGEYEARAFLNDGYMLAGKVAFTVGGSPDVTTSAPNYAFGDPVVVNYANLPGNQKDWIAVAPAGSPNSSYLQWSYTNGAVSGMASFSNLSPGSYVARAFVNDTFTLIGEVPFTVGSGAASVTTMAQWTTADTITVDFAGLPGNNNDWISISAAGSSDASYLHYVYTNGATSGTATFTGVTLAPGMYEARAYLRDLTTTKVATFAFEVVAAGP